MAVILSAMVVYPEDSGIDNAVEDMAIATGDKHAMLAPQVWRMPTSPESIR